MENRLEAQIEHLGESQSTLHDEELGVEKEQSIENIRDDSSPVKRNAEPNLEKILSNSTTNFIPRLTTQVIDPGPPPDGGTSAWVQCAMAWICCFATWGYINSFGVFQTYYIQILDESQSTISWIGSVQLWIVFFVSTFAGRALDAGLFLPTMIIGLIFHLIGIFATSFCHSLWQFVLAQGICTGIGSGALFCPPVGLVTTYFLKKRGLAMAIISTGNSVGGVLYPVIVRQLLPKIGFGWTIRVLGFLNLILLTLAIAVLKPRLPPRKSGPVIEWRAFTEIPYLFAVLGIAFIFGGMYFVYYFIASYGRTVLGMSYTDSANILMIFNGAAIPIRLITGYVADRFLGPLNTMIPLIILNAIFGFIWIAIHTDTEMYVFTTFYGFTLNACQCLFPTALTSLNSDLSKNGTRLGMAFSVFSFAGLAGPPIGGALVALNGGGRGGYLIAQICLGLMTGFGSCLFIVARVYKHGWSLCVKC